MCPKAKDNVGQIFFNANHHGTQLAHNEGSSLNSISKETLPRQKATTPSAMTKSRRRITLTLLLGLGLIPSIET